MEVFSSRSAPVAEVIAALVAVVARAIRKVGFCPVVMPLELVFAYTLIV